MKKYLIIGVLALVTGGFLTSCHDTEGAYSSIVEQKLQAYEQVFKEEFGEIDPNQDWGFGEASTAARMRTRATTTPPGYPEGYSGAYPNANQWASQGYNVPDPLTPGQKARVQFFFQTKKNPGGTDDYGQIDFFIQQVYDGCTDPITEYEGYTSPTYSQEQYLAADEQTMIQSGEHMDHLVAGSDNKHIYNFNNGTCSTNYNVGDTGAPLDTDQHPDEIMLMINTKTDYFGYANSDASFVRNDRYNLVAGSTIDAYIEEHMAEYIAWKNKNDNFKNEKDDIVDDDWHRGFIGFDFDQLPDKSTISGYTETKDADGFVISSSADYAELGGFPGGVEYVWDGKKVTKISSWDNYAPIYSVFGDKYLHYKNGKKVPYVITDMNEYCGVTKGYDGENGHRDFATSASINSTGAGTNNDQCVFIEQVEYEHDGQTEKVKAFNLKWLNMMLDEGYCPVAGKSMKLWTKVGGCADGYYSDWIVSFLPANAAVTPQTTIDIEPGGGTKKVWKITTRMWELSLAERGRIMCEDLGVIKASDIDFNDLVFDAYIYDGTEVVKVEYVDESNQPIPGYTPSITRIEDNTKRFTDIYILAAGGTLPITVANERVKDHFSDNYHTGSISDAIIVNTCTRDGDGDGGSYTNPWQNYDTAQKIEKDDIQTLKDIRVVVQYGNKILELYSEPGLAPHKICVPLELENGIDVRWPLERVVIKDAYNDFTKYVKNETENIVFNKDNKSEEGDSDSNNKQGKSYINWEQSESCWTTGEIKTTKLFNETVSYTPRNLNSDDKYIIISSTNEEEYIPDTSKGYQPNDNILVRRRH